jgi:regulator of sigma E protease
LESSRDPNRTHEIERTPSVSSPEEAAASPRGWLRRNGPYLLVVAALLLFLHFYFDMDLDDLRKGIYVVLGLGFVIFIHELGHFLVAKWCDVHVETFSIGFGPPLPGCCFKRGETTYMIALFPLGGYVKMVGEGAENDESDTDPRSFKNKPVWQRMAIISAGVTMNLLLGFLCFVYVFETHGDEQTPSVIGIVEAGSPAWRKGVRSGQDIYWIGDHGPNPSFLDELQPTVMNSRQGESLRFVFGPPSASEKELIKTEIEPRKEKGDLRPMIGISPPQQLKLVPAKYRKRQGVPFSLTSAAAEAQPAFHFGDAIVACSFDPEHPEEIKELPPDPRYPQHRDYFEFERRLRAMAGKPMRIEVHREDSGQAATIDVPPSYHYTFGLRMRMGKITAIRDQSPAAAAGVQPEDIIDQVEVDTPKGKVRYVTSRTEGVEHGAGGVEPGNVEEKDLDPIRLDFELNQWAAQQTGAREVTLTVLRKNPPPNHNERNQVKLTLRWDDQWKGNNEAQIRASGALSIACLGIAFKVESTVAGVVPESPADKAGFKPGDVIKEWQPFVAGKKPGKEPKPGDWIPVEPDDGAYAFSFIQSYDFKKVNIRIDRDKMELAVTAEEDHTWPQYERGLLLAADDRLERADSLGQALTMGVRKTKNFILQILGNIRSVITGRVSYKVLGGPIMIAGVAFQFADDIYKFLIFLGIIGVNLAVVNFLPIPVLDGGHMVFLIYEKLRGKPAPERFRVAATMLGVALILFLMVFFTYQDVLKFW